MKRTVLSYVFTLVVILCCFSAVYSIQYDRLKQELANQRDSDSETDSGKGGSEAADDRETQSDVLQGEESSSLPEGEESTSNRESGAEEADAKGELRTNSSMLYVVGQYDWSTGKVTETVEKFPEELLDLTRQELLIFLRENPEYGSLLSFSEHAVYMRKTDHPDWSEYSFFLRLEEDGLMVYRLEDDSLYLDTGIKEEELSEENCELLREGLYIRDNAALFDYLQTVTS